MHAGWLAGAVFVVALLALGALTPGYAHAHQPVDFLGMDGVRLPYSPGYAQRITLALYFPWLAPAWLTALKSGGG